MPKPKCCQVYTEEHDVLSTPIKSHKQCSPWRFEKYLSTHHMHRPTQITLILPVQLPGAILSSSKIFKAVPNHPGRLVRKTVRLCKKNHLVRVNRQAVTKYKFSQALLQTNHDRYFVNSFSIPIHRLRF